jgi:hypothetical protein
MKTNDANRMHQWLQDFNGAGLEYNEMKNNNDDQKGKEKHRQQFIIEELNFRMRMNRKMIRVCAFRVIRMSMINCPTIQQAVIMAIEECIVAVQEKAPQKQKNQ